MGMLPVEQIKARISSDLASEGANSKKMLHWLWFLIAEQALGCMRQAKPSQPFCDPSSTSVA
jgi:hypothetical protein